MIISVKSEMEREYDRQTGNWDWQIVYVVTYSDGLVIRDWGWDPEYAKFI